MSYKTIQLSKAADIIVGFPFASEKFNINAQGTRLVRGKNITTGNLRWGDDTRWWDDSSIDLSKYMLKADDIVIGMDGSLVGKNYAKISENDLPLLLVQRVACIRAKEGYDQRFLWGCIASGNFERYIDSIKTGTSIPHISGGQIGNYLIPDFDLQSQKKIAAILSALDEKIATNREINDNLQQQLRTIFKAEFTDNPELENITQIPLSELCHVVTKGTTPTTLGKPFVESGINFIKAESILDEHSIDKSKFAFIDEETNALLKRSIIHAGDVVFTIAGTLGRFALIDENVLPANTNQAVAIIRADVEKVLPEYIYTCFIGEWHTDYYAKRVQQAVQANLSLTTIKSLPIPLLDEAKMSEYLSLILPLIKAIKTNEAQNEKLAALRDNLLPKLMSGEIDVSDIQL